MGASRAGTKETPDATPIRRVVRHVVEFGQRDCGSRGCVSSGAGKGPGGAEEVREGLPNPCCLLSPSPCCLSLRPQDNAIACRAERRKVREVPRRSGRGISPALAAFPAPAHAALFRPREKRRPTGNCRPKGETHGGASVRGSGESRKGPGGGLAQPLLPFLGLPEVSTPSCSLRSPWELQARWPKAKPRRLPGGPGGA